MAEKYNQHNTPKYINLHVELCSFLLLKSFFFRNPQRQLGGRNDLEQWLTHLPVQRTQDTNRTTNSNCSVSEQKRPRMRPAVEWSWLICCSWLWGPGSTPLYLCVDILCVVNWLHSGASEIALKNDNFDNNNNNNNNISLIREQMSCHVQWSVRSLHQPLNHTRLVKSVSLSDRFVVTQTAVKNPGLSAHVPTLQV